ncbi:hypothetical protein ACTVJH_14480 [Desulfoplanes sp. PS50]
MGNKSSNPINTGRASCFAASLVKRKKRPEENMSDCGCRAKLAERLKKRTLGILLAINAFMFVVV